MGKREKTKTFQSKRYVVRVRYFLELCRVPTILGCIFFVIFLILGIGYILALTNLPLQVITTTVFLVLLYLPFATKKHFEEHKEPEEERLLYSVLIVISGLVISYLLGYSNEIKSTAFGSAIIIIGILPLLTSIYSRIWQKDIFLSYTFISISLFIEAMIILIVIFAAFGL